MTYDDLKDDVYFLTGSTSTSYSDASLTRNLNRAYDRAATTIVNADGRWQWDDSNNADQPVATTALVADQQGYAFAAEHLKLQRAEVQDDTGAWLKLLPIDAADLFDQSVTDFLGTSGTPRYYDKVGQVINLYPAPSYAQAASLKLWFQRGPSYFATSDTTKAPGFSTIHHRCLSLSAAADYALAQTLPQAGKLQERADAAFQALADDYSGREPDDRPQLRVRRYRFN